MDTTSYRVGKWSALLAFSATMAFTTAQILQLFGMLVYPLDQILIFGFSLCIVIPFLLAMLALHYTVSDNNKFWSHAALLFTMLYAVFVTANYVVQLATVIPFTMQGKEQEIGLLSQTPHSLFWDFDAIGYSCMGLAMVFAAQVFRRQGSEKWVRWSFLLHASMTPLIVWVYFYPVFSDRLLLLAIPWSVTAPLSMLLLALHFSKSVDLNREKIK
jgi:hypothetical protein